MENIENKIPNGENQDTQNSSFFSENVSSSNGLEPKIRFVNFKENYRPLKIGDIYAERSERGAENMELLSVTINEGVKKRMDIDGKDTSSEDKSNYKIVHTGDMVYNSMRMWQGANGISDYDGIVSPAYTVLKSKGNIHNQYIGFLFKNSELINKFRKNSQGLTSDTWNLKYPQIACIKINIPSLDEQQKIADFLSLVDQRIEKQRQLVESLKKYKRGLLSAIFDKISSTSTLTLGEICNITTGKLDANAMVVGGKYRFYTCAREYFEIDTYAFDTDALLISGNGANVGYIHHYCGKFNAYQRTYVLDGFQENIMYIYYYLQANLHPRIEAEKKAGNTPYIVLSTLSDMLIKLPAKERQNNIAKIFAILDKKIMVENDVLERLNTQKQGLLQQMFI